MKLDLLTNATVVDDAIRFVSQNSQYKQKLKSASGKGDEEGSNGSDHDNEDQGRLEEEQDEETREITATNQIF